MGQEEKNRKTDSPSGPEASPSQAGQPRWKVSGALFDSARIDASVLPIPDHRNQNHNQYPPSLSRPPSHTSLTPLTRYLDSDYTVMKVLGQIQSPPSYTIEMANYGHLIQSPTSSARRSTAGQAEPTPPMQSAAPTTPLHMPHG